MENDDVKSTNSSPGGETLEQKHNRLLAEHAKVRSQLAVLKNVVVEEKNNTAELKSQMRQKDQAIRRLEQETESIRFLNGQMQTRLVILQKDLMERDTKSKSSRRKEPAQPSVASSSTELNADFVQLVEINAHLSSKLNSVQTEMETRVNELESKLRDAAVAEKNAVNQLTEYKEMFQEVENRVKAECEAAWRKEVSEHKGSVFDLRTENSILKSELEKAKNDIDSLQKNNTDVAQQSLFIKSLSEQIDSQKEQLVKLQQDREEWMYKAQILTLKSSSSQAELPLERSDSGDSRTTEMEAPVNQVESSLRTRINTLISDLQLADGKALYFQAECSALHLRLQMVEDDKRKVDQRLSEARNHIDELKKQFESTVIHTNEQISLMSEHLASMNEKLQTKTDEINILKYERDNRLPKAATQPKYSAQKGQR
ncbi:protein phosphatase 1 regulatory subunit 21-like [Paramacrobiotus metropolitanus]|uniref:protein phosphatase 1 regulatory subunit 21-like n=1 Tax=Paramacrobiotus metropolitanus TaxID=2943436 RepID=UPI00244613C8|nr:protein phosphatase 1 regulatory subunit 21-like [Paramacrobiotus metropolitanus]